MLETIRWLTKIEEMAADLYKDASMLFSADKDFSDFLSLMAEDELWHSHLLSTAEGFMQEEENVVFFNDVDRKTRKKIEDPFNEIYSMLLAGILTKEALIDCIVTSEFSELNTVFLNIVNSMKEKNSVFMHVASKMRDHTSRIEKFLEALPDGQKYMERIRRLPGI